MADLLRNRTEPVRSYEMVVIYRPELAQEKTDTAISHITDIVKGSGGTMDAVDIWGRRKLAYPIRHQAEGYYVLYKFHAGASLIKKIAGELRISEDIMRHLVIAPEA